MVLFLIKMLENYWNSVPLTIWTFGVSEWCGWCNGNWPDWSNWCGSPCAECIWSGRWRTLRRRPVGRCSTHLLSRRTSSRWTACDGGCIRRTTAYKRRGWCGRSASDPALSGWQSASRSSGTFDTGDVWRPDSATIVVGGGTPCRPNCPDEPAHRPPAGV